LQAGSRRSNCRSSQNSSGSKFLPISGLGVLSKVIPKK